MGSCSGGAPPPRPSGVLMLTARYGIGDRDKPVTAAMTSAGAKVTAIQMDTDHSFSDHRIALSQAVVRWLQSLPLRP